MVGPEHWTGSKNVLFENSRTSKRGGYAPMSGTPLFTPLLVQYTVLGTGSYWVYAGKEGIGVWDGTTHTNITPADWVQQDEPLTLCLINNIPVINNPSNTPYYWPGSGLCVALPGWDGLPNNTRCKGIFSNLYHLFAYYVTEDAVNFAGSRVRWSDAAAPGTVPGVWVPAGDNQAGFVDLPTPDGPIVGGASLREQAMIFKNNAVIAGRFIGGQFIYSFDVVFESVGLLSPNAIEEIDGSLVFVGQDSVYQTDGNQVRDIADGWVKEAIFRDMSKDHYLRTFCTLNREVEQVFIGVPTSVSKGGCDAVFGYSFSDSTWSFLMLNTEVTDADIGDPNIETPPSPTWDTLGSTWELVEGVWKEAAVVSSTTGYVFASSSGLINFNGGNLDGSETIPVSFEKLGVDLGKIEVQKRVTRIWPKFEEGRGVVQISVGASQFANDQPVWEGPYDFNLGIDRSLPVNSLGRAFSFKVEENGTAFQWAFTGVDFDFVEAGRF